ncbi:hypothetical protein [Paenibacillus sp. MBLB4367]|uniref:hypothetical protein n=1 Tax=Paenibacillus sp. MBLB4367 TaxID=3384767 RepID=UPI003907F3E4
MKNIETELSIPVHIQPFRELIREQYAKAIHQVRAKRVFLAASIHIGHLPHYEVVREETAILKESIESYRKLGIQVAYWGNTIGHGGSLLESVPHSFQEIVGPRGMTVSGAYCPLDKGFQRYIGQAYAIIAESGVEMLMLDDDFRLHLRGPEAPIGCFCPLHMEAFQQRIGREISREQLVEEVLHGKPSPLREHWLAVIGDSLLHLAAVIEQAVHAVNPDARIGLCAVMSHWVHEGVTMEQLLRTLSGSTRPFLRTIGAPYWSKEPHNIGWIIEYTRLQAHWLRDLDVELMAEGDTYPQNRYHCSAATLKAFNRGIRAAGIPGLLAYGLHFSLPPELEPGYMRMLRENEDFDEAIHRFCPSNYSSLGVTPVIQPYAFSRLSLPNTESNAHYAWPDEPVALHYLSRLGIPVSHSDRSSPVLLAGTGAEGLTDVEINLLLDRGVVLDGAAAAMLLEKGFDIGYESFQPARTPVFERYMDKNTCGSYTGEYMWSIGFGPKGFYRGDPKQSAVIVTEFLGLRLEPMYCGVVHYENDKGQRLCILPFDLHDARHSKQLMYNYARQEQLATSLAWVNRKSLPAVLLHHPDVHLMCFLSSGKDRLVIAIHNLSLDRIVDPIIRFDPDIGLTGGIEWLSEEGSAISSDDYRCEKDERFGYLHLKTILPPMGFIAIAVNRPWG